MQLKDLSKKTILIAVFTGFLAVSPIFVFSFIPEITIPRTLESLIQNVFAPLAPEPVSSGLPVGQVSKPVRLIIPKINVDSDIELVGLTSKGAMDTPKGPDVAWFDLGPKPGETGSAVIAGHYGRQNNKGSVFDDLHKLHKGDDVYVEDDKGMIISFVVRESRRYDSGADASSVFGSNDGKSHLNLITCEGVWDESTQQYSKRLVVFTDREYN